MKKSVIAIVMILSLVFVLSGCQRAGTWCPSPGVCVFPEEITEDETEDISEEIIIPEEEQPDIIEESEEIIEEVEEEIDETIEEITTEADMVVTEGELVKLSPEATDPEGDVVTFTFSEPLDDNGEWQTEIGDAGTYTITVIASDGVNEVSQEFTILVRPANRPPVLDVPAMIEVNEGETVVIEPEVSDPEGDDVEITYSGWMTSDTYKTTYNDAGEYIVTVTATDGVNEVSDDILITVNDVNRAPVMERVSDITISEGEEISVDIDATDPDGDTLSVEFSEPLDDNGEWQTEIGDAGTYTVSVIVSDGVNEISQDFDVIVESVNRPPVLDVPAMIEVNEGETVVIEPEVSDPEGDDIEITYSGWMTSDTYQTDYDDAGEYIVTVTATDGVNEVSDDILITVNDVNRPPEFVI
jgi:hypothetical protein